MPKKPGLYANINAKRKRIESGSHERMARRGEEGRPSAAAFKAAAKTAKPRKPKKKK
jgi:cysteine sulfinate desulfinase/cysteine desulfurase-like protein